MVVIHQFVDSFSTMTAGIWTVGILSGLFLRPSLATVPRKDVLIVVEVPVFVLVEMSLHDGI